MFVATLFIKKRNQMCGSKNLSYPDPDLALEKDIFIPYFIIDQ